MTPAFVGLGSNLGDPLATVRAAIEEIERIPNCRVLARSSLYRTAPVGLRNQPDFINAVVKLEAGIGPAALLQALFDIEERFGRMREFHHAPRTLDLDLLICGDLVSGDPQLTLPHPRMHERAFVLAPLLEIAPGCVIPGKGPAADWLRACAGQRVTRLPGR